MKVPEACEAYLRDIKARNLRPSTIVSHECLLRLVQAWAREDSIEGALYTVLTKAPGDFSGKIQEKHL